MNTIVIIGHGQLGHELSNRHLKAADQVISVSRTQKTPQALNHQHISADLDTIDDKLPLPRKIDCLYYFAPPSDNDLTDQRLKKFIALHHGHIISHAIYISTSGVYGDKNGEWVTEDALTNPSAARAKRRLNAEHQLISFQNKRDVPVTILRCAAIYSSKTINLNRISANTKPVIRVEEAPYTNRIHLKDLTEVCWQAMLNPPEETEIYNVSDGQPSTTTDHSWLLADMAGVTRNKPISLSEADQYYSPAYMSYLNESKRLDISKLKKLLNPVFEFENCIDGINECLKNSNK